MAYYKTAVSPLLMHCRYRSLALSHRYRHLSGIDWVIHGSYAPVPVQFNTLLVSHQGSPLLITLRRRQNGRHFADAIFKCIFLNENVWISIKISLKFVPKGPINNIPALVQIMAWCRPSDKLLSEAMMVNLATHLCVSRPQWVIWNWTVEISPSEMLDIET